MKIYPNTKIYIICPGNLNSGGPELCHQLCSQLIQFGANAFMMYLENSSIPLNKEDPVHDFYKKYHLPYTFELEDEPQNILVIPETSFYFTKKIQRVLWWMSVDNYFNSLSNLMRTITHSIRVDSEPVPNIFLFNNRDEKLTHFVQSEYARKFLIVNKIPKRKIYMVEDYLNQAFLSRAAKVDLSRKENFVAYNPRKGVEATEYLINLAPNIDWRPIKNMTPEQVQELLAKAKVYIDFGNHPGKDRIPREAAISGCVVITGKRGAANNDIDINIPDEFKFDERTDNPQQVIEKIREVFENFSDAHEKQADYRARILDDKNRFVREVADAFELKNAVGGGVAILRTVNKETYYFAYAIIQGGKFMPKFIVDDKAASAKKVAGEVLLREQNRNFLRVGENLIEIITRDDAKFLYQEGRIKKFALLEPTDAELDDLQNFYEPDINDILVFNR